MRLKKVFPTLKNTSVLSSLFVATFVKARFSVFGLPDWQKAKNEQKNRRTSSTSFLLGFSFSLQNGFVHKKKQFVCWKLCFLRIQRKKDFLICSRNNFWVACFKNRSNCWTSVVLRRVLKKRQRWRKHFDFFFADFAWLSTKFFLKLFFFFASQKSLFLEAKPLKTKHVKKPCFSCPHKVKRTNDSLVNHFSFWLKLWFRCNKQKKPIIVLFFLMPSEKHSPPKR